MPTPQPGSIGWLDLTVDNADEVRDFYQAVVGWTSQSVPMGDYSDYCMKPHDAADPVAGICHAAGPNTGLPAVWLMYITVADLGAAIAACTAKGGEVLQRREPDSHGQMAVIRDPAGAVCALYQPAKATL
jgi:predicted enzyme related to lactoylglutathione lyase